MMIVLAATIAWEVYVRSVGYGPTLNDTSDLWAQVRRKVQPGSIVIVGDSRPWFDCDLDELERGLGSRPLQLAQAGSCAFPVLDDLIKDENFHGTVICSIVPLMFFAPAGPLLETSQKAVKRYHTQTLTQRASHLLGIPLEEHVAFLKQEELDTAELLKRLRIPNRPGALVPPTFPPYFCTVDRERRARMIERGAQPGPLQTRVRDGWIPLFTPPPPPTYIPREVFLEHVKQAIEQRFVDTAADVAKLRARGGKIVFVRFPVTGGLKELEDKATPRDGMWERLLKETSAPGIYFEDFPELASFNCPEWSHLSADDSVEFTRRLVPHLRTALGM
ncbi:MAG: hypothetical protein ACXV8A_04055 [Chthoniobacterales bacterium]